MTTTQMVPTAITIRPAYAGDDAALGRLAALDSAEAAPLSPLLLAEVDGVLRVALSLKDGGAIADPFFPTAELLALLRRHASHQRSRPWWRLPTAVRGTIAEALS